MKITIQFIEPSYAPKKNDILVFKMPKLKTKKGTLKRIVTTNNGKEYYININNTQWLIPTLWIKYIERNIINSCNLPATKDLLDQLQPGDKVLLKTQKENPHFLCYDTGNVFAEISKHLGTEITIKKLVILLSNIKAIVDNNGNPWFYNEIKTITFIKK